ncbi:tetratricopeptide repeat protein [Thermodesulfobacteriota bacterium]
MKKIFLIISFLICLMFCFCSTGWAGGLDDARAGWEAYKRKKWDAALILYTRAIESGELRREVSIKVYFLRGVVYFKKNQYQNGKDDFDKAIKMNINTAAAYCNRGFAYVQEGQYEMAMSDYNKAIELEPEHPESYNSMAWIFATCPDPKYRNSKKALEYALKSVSIKKNFKNMDTLAAAYAETGDFAMAVKSEEEAISMCPDPKLKEEFKRVLEAYKQGMTYVQFKKGI